MQYDTSRLNFDLQPKVTAIIDYMRNRSSSWNDIEAAYEARNITKTIFFSDPSLVPEDQRGQIINEAAASMIGVFNGELVKMVYVSTTRGSYVAADRDFDFFPTVRTSQNAPSSDWLQSFDLTLRVRPQNPAL